MALNSLLSVFRRRAAPVQQDIFPFFGVAAPVAQSAKNSAFILALTGRGPTASRQCPSFTLDSAGNNQTMYYAYPVSYGQAIFTDVAAGYQGGWDGAHGDYGQTLGPITVTVTINGSPVDFYLYQTDYPNLGSVEWSVT